MGATTEGGQEHAAKTAHVPTLADVEALRREIERLKALAGPHLEILEAILNHSPHGIMVCDASGKLILQNRAAEQIWAGSASVEDVTGWGQYRAFHGDGRPFAAADWSMARCLRSGETIPYEELRVQRFDGSRAMLLGSCAPIRDVGGAITGALSMFADITELRQSQTEATLLLGLAERTAAATSVQAVFDAGLDSACAALVVPRAAILLFDADGVMRFKAWRGLSETYRAAVDGHSPWRPEQKDPAPVVVGDVTKEPSLAAFGSTFLDERIGALAFFPLAYEGRLLGKLMTYSEPVRELSPREVRLAMALSGHVASCVVRQQAVEREREATARLEAGMRAREQILSVVSHDLRTPLGGILTAADLLDRLHIESPTGERVRRSIDSIRRLTTRMSRLISDLMDFASIEGGLFSVDRIDTSPEDIVSATLEAFLAPAAEREIEIDARVASECPRLHADEERVVQALTNIVSNAVGVTPRGGRITLVADCTTQHVRFSVTDTGPGIHADELPHLFERYWRSPRAAYKGTGLGLPIAKAIIEAHGGTIWAESEPGRGSTFHFDLPASPRVS